MGRKRWCDIETIGFFGGDARMARLAGLFASDGYEVKSWGLAGMPETAPSETAKASRVVLPVPLSEDGRLRGTNLPLGELWPRLDPARRVYAGAVPEAERARAESLGLHIVDYFTDEALTVKNAVPTAEGAIAAAMERLPVTLHGTPCLVIGFGRIGKLLARDLSALGAEVGVSARRPGDLAWIGALGYTPLHTEHLSGTLGAYRAVFNTVPAMVLRETLLRELRRDCVLIELASKSGMDTDAVRLLGLDYVKAGGLPGKVAPETAARAIQETLYRIWEDEKI